MRKWIGITGCLAVIGLIVGPATGAPTQVLQNPDLEAGPVDLQANKLLAMPDHFWLEDVWCGKGSWPGERTEGFAVVKYEDWDDSPHTWGSFNTYPHSGDRMIFCKEEGCGEGGTIEQTVAVGTPGLDTPGQYQLTMSFWAKMYDMGSRPAYTIGKLIVDGEIVAVGSLYGDAEHAGAVVKKNEYTNVLATWQGQVNSSVTVKIILLAEGQVATPYQDCNYTPGGAGALGVAVVDDIELFVSNCSAQPAVSDVSPSVADYVPIAATATVTISGPAGEVVDGDGIHIDTGGINRWYEFDTDDTCSPLRVAVDVSPGNGGPGQANAKTQLIATINNDECVLWTASDGGGDVVLLTWKTTGGDGGTNTNWPDPNEMIETTNFSIPAQPTMDVTITGSNLLNVGSVRMVGVRNAPEITGAIVAQGDNELTVRVTTNTKPRGRYDVILEPSDPDCNPCVVTNGFEIVDSGEQSNLLINPSFQVPEADGNAVIWLGDYIQDPSYEVTPGHLDGYNVHQTWSISSDGGAEGATTWQTVPVSPGASVTFVGYLACKDTGSGTSTATVTVYDGVPGALPALGSGGVDQDTVGTWPPPDGDWTQITLASLGPVTAGFVTVELEAVITPSGGGSSAWADMFSLTVDPEPNERVHPTVCYPSWVVSSMGEFWVTLTGGSNLDDPDLAVNLVNVDGMETVEGVISDATSTGLTVTFPIADRIPTPAPVGLYNVVVEKPSCRIPILDVDPRHWQGWGTTWSYIPQDVIPPHFIDKINIRSNLLENGSFELPDPAQAPCSGVIMDPRPTAWYSDAPNGVFRDGQAPFPDGCPNPTDGGHHGSMSEGGLAGTVRAWQTVTTGIPNAKYRFAGEFDAPPGVTITLRLLEGDEYGTELASTQFTDNDPLGWVAAQVEGQATSATVTVVWEMDLTDVLPNVGGHADGLSLAIIDVICNNLVFADTDDDGDVDQDDFAVLQLCLTGTGGGVPLEPVYCTCLDVDGEPGDDVDQADVMAFEGCASGPGVAADTLCDGPP